MATSLTKTVKRKVAGLDRRDIVVTLYPNNLIGFRPARTRKEHVLPLAKCYRMACEATIEADRRAKEQAKNDRRAERGLPPLRRLVSRGKLGGR